MTRALVVAGLIGIAAVFAVVAWLVLRRSGQSSVVLGQQLADAQAVERRRLERNPGHSPLAGKSYNGESDGYQLFRISKSPLDETIRSLVRSFSRGSDQSRAELRDRLSMDDLYTLVQYSKRSAVFAMREKDPEFCADGLAALAAIDVERVDPRDLSWAIGIVDAAAAHIRADRMKLKATVLPLVVPASQAAFAELGSLDPERASFETWGYRVAASPSGLGLVRFEFEPYSPSVDLLKVAVRASDVVAAPRYPQAEFTLATSIPPVWLGSDDPRVKDVLNRSSGTVMLRLSERNSAVLGGQLFNLYFSELASASDAEWLASIAAKDQPGRAATAAFATGKMVCVGVTASTAVGKPSVESTDTLRLALQPVQELLSRQ
jgi:hypothetical protein